MFIEKDNRLILALIRKLVQVRNSLKKPKKQCLKKYGSFKNRIFVLALDNLAKFLGHLPFIFVC
jgi:hypothetical protein